MGAWDHGLFANDHDQDIICELNEAAGLNKLQKIVAQRVAAKQDKSGKGKTKQAKDGEDEKMEPYYSICGGGEAPDEIRKHLDSGVLEKMFAKKEQEILNPPKGAWFTPDYTFCLGACAMTLGCRIPPHYKVMMQKHFLNAGFLEPSERQLFKALNGPDGYEDGKPYPFELPEDVVAAHEAEMEKRKARGGILMMNVPAPFGFFPTPPPKDKILRAKMEEGKYGPRVCGGCAADKKDGEALLCCGKCKKRGYCSAECQKEHWKLHKKVCTPAEAEGGGKENSAPQVTIKTGRGS